MKQIITTKKPKFETKILHNLQLQSKVFSDLIFRIKISNDWDSLIGRSAIIFYQQI